MKQGMKLIEMAQEIERIERSKRDYIAPTTKLHMTVVGDPNLEDGGFETEMTVEGNGTYSIGEVAHEQIADRLGIPFRYYNRMLSEAPQLAAANVNTWLNKKPERRLIRTLDGRVRAFLSDRYRPLDNALIAQATLPVLMEQGEQIKVKSTALTERRLYIQAINERIAGEVRVGDTVQAGVVISNSEVGCGSVRVEPLIYRLACLNGMIRASALKRYHVGKRIETDGIVNYEFYETETIEADNRAFLLKIRDTVRHAFDEIKFVEEIERLKAATEREIPPAKIQDTVEEVTRRFSLTQGEGENVLGFLIRDGDLTQYGMANAVTSFANTVESYDRAVELERIGGQVIDLDPKEWQALTS